MWLQHACCNNARCHPPAHEDVPEGKRRRAAGRLKMMGRMRRLGVCDTFRSAPPSTLRTRSGNLSGTSMPLWREKDLRGHIWPASAWQAETEGDDASQADGEASDAHPRHPSSQIACPSSNGPKGYHEKTKWQCEPRRANAFCFPIVSLPSPVSACGGTTFEER
jgi:hypothetical protein